MDVGYHVYRSLTRTSLLIRLLPLLRGVGSLAFRRWCLLHALLLLYRRVLLYALVGRLHHRLRDLSGGLRLRAVAAAAALT